MTAGDAILVVIAAANRDPAATPLPDRLVLFRRNVRSFTFGAGTHACPGERLATTIAAAGVAHLLGSGLDPGRDLTAFTYRPSLNTRVPVFANT